jgi:hypothetical protein
LGTGERGSLAAEADGAARKAHRQAAQRRAEDARPVEGLAALIGTFGELVDRLVACQLASEKWKLHHRQWRAPARVNDRNDCSG